MRDKLHTNRTVVVEGRYDAARIAGLLDAMILQTDGFAIYRDTARQQLLRILAKDHGLLLLTDSDAAGFRIRTFVTEIAGAANVLQVYAPAQAGKEARKALPGKEGLLGVEGIEDDVLYPILKKALASDRMAALSPAGDGIRRVEYPDLYEWGLSGSAGAAARKAKFLQALGLPPRLSKKELVEVLNRLYSYTELEELAARLNQRPE